MVTHGVGAEKTAQADSADAEQDTYDSKGAWLVSLAHFAHDLYPAFIGVFIPLIQSKLGLSLTIASLMVLAHQIPSVVQPFIGYITDRTNRRWFVILSPSITAVSISMVGLAPHFAIVLVLLLVSGLSSATFHPPAISLVGDYGGNKMGRAMAIFTAGGELSRTLGPLFVTAVIALLTLEGSAVVMVFGLVGSLILYVALETSGKDQARHERGRTAVWPLVKARTKPLSGLFGYTVINALSTVPYQFFLVALLVSQGNSEWYAGTALSILFGAGVFGGFVGGILSDRIGRKRALVLAKVMAPPIFFLYLYLNDGSWWVLSILILVGLVSMSVRPIRQAQAQELMPEARGAIAGMIMATGFVTMSLGSLAFGALGDWLGIEMAFWIISVTPFLALPFISLLPSQDGKPARPSDG